MANLATRVPKASWPMIATLVRSIFEQPDRDATWTQLGDVVDRLTQAGFCDIAVILLDAADDVLAFSAFPVEHWPKIRSNNPQERLNKEIRRRTDVVGIFPNRAAVIRLVGALLGRADRRMGHHQALHERRGTQDRPLRRTIRRRPETGDGGGCYALTEPETTEPNPRHQSNAHATTSNIARKETSSHRAHSMI